MSLWWHICYKRKKKKATEVNYTMVTPVSPQAKGGHLFFQVSKHKVQLLHICSWAHRPKQTLLRVGYLLFLHLTHTEMKAVSGQRQTDWLTRVRGVSYSYTHTHTHAVTQRLADTHEPWSTTRRQRNWSFNQNKDKESTPTPDCNERHKVRGTPLPLPPHTQRLRKTSQLPPFSQSGNS